MYTHRLIQGLRGYKRYKMITILKVTQDVYNHLNVMYFRVSIGIRKWNSFI